MKADKLRKIYLDFFVKKDHKIINSAPLIPENDPTVLFTTAGMHPLVPFLLGEKHPSGNRLVNVQKCLRTDDIELIGDATHNTFFEMLGNWSLGDYFKEKAICYSYEFLIKILKLDKNKIAISCYKGNKKNNIPKDTQSYKIWNQIGIPKERIVFLDDNWWGPAGETGPCGPDTEMFYWIGKKEAPKIFDPSNNLWVEIWNDVFMQYNKIKDNKFIPLKQKNVDTGMGLERTLMILNNKENIYDTELFIPLIQEIKKYSKKYNEKYSRITTDHLRASIFLIADGVTPSNLDQGYILRRLIRRSIRYINLLNIFDKNFLDAFIGVVIKNYQETYPEIKKYNLIKEVIHKEKNKFEKALVVGEKEFSKMINILKSHNQDTISGRLAFKLYESYGFPYELTEELAKEEGFKVNKQDFEKAYQKHQLLSRKGSEAKFKGGLADDSEVVTKYHTATHLLHQALRMVLGDYVSQKGSNITKDRLRFDFSHNKKLTQEEIKKVEDIVNKQISKKLTVSMSQMDLKTAKEKGALGFFESRYGKIVKVYTIGLSDKDYFSREICGGPHVKNTKELGKFKIISEKSSSQGIRRIKAILEQK